MAFLDIADDEAEALERKLESSTTPPRYYHCDLKSVETIRELFPRIRSELGGVDILVNNAANDDRHALKGTAKAGIEGLTRGLARDLGTFGIRVNCVVPGGVRTPRQMKLWHTPDEEARMLGLQCIKARVEPHDVANMVVFLASDDARMCTGHEYFVDAGWR